MYPLPTVRCKYKLKLSPHPANIVLPNQNSRTKGSPVVESFFVREIPVHLSCLVLVGSTTGGLIWQTVENVPIQLIVHIFHSRQISIGYKNVTYKYKCLYCP